MNLTMNQTSPPLLPVDNNCTGNVNTSFNGSVLDSLSTSPSQTALFIQVLTLTVILLASLLVNSLVFVVFYTKPLLLTISNRFVLNLSASNFIMSMVVMPQSLVASLTVSWKLGAVWCQMTGVLTTLLFAACITTLLLISVDRFYAIMKPLHYSMCITAQRASWLLAAVWIFSLLISLPPVLGWNQIIYHRDMRICTVDWSSQTIPGRAYTFTVVLLCFVVPFGVMCWVYVTAFQQAKQSILRARRNSLTAEQALDQAVSQAMLINQRRRSSTVSLFQIINSPLRRRSSSSNGSRKSLNLNHGDDWRAAKTGLICMSTFTLCWLPFFIMISLKAAIPPAMLELPTWFSLATIWVAFLSCALNPLVYVFRNSGIRREIRQMCGKQDVWSNGAVTNYVGNSGDVSRRNSLCAQNGRQIIGGNTYPQIAALISNGNGNAGDAQMSRTSSVVTFNTGQIENRQMPLLKV